MSICFGPSPSDSSQLGHLPDDLTEVLDEYIECDLQLGYQTWPAGQSPIDDFPVTTSISRGFPGATFDYQRVKGKQKHRIHQVAVQMERRTPQGSEYGNLRGADTQ